MRNLTALKLASLKSSHTTISSGTRMAHKTPNCTNLVQLGWGIKSSIL